MRFVRTWILSGAILALAITSGGCSTTAAEGQAGEDAAANAAAVQPGGARAWEQNCARCHNYRRPRERDDGEWRIIVHHMRVRANLTAREAEAILRFLQAAN